MKLGNRFIYDQNGIILHQTGEMEGDILPRKEISELGWVELEYGSVDYEKYRITGIDVGTKQPILEEIVKDKTQKEITQELENQILLLENSKIGGIL